jgi:uncharacterized protein YbjT (DUF2867 family)
MTTSGTATILAVGAAGKFAGLVIPELARRGARVRGLVRDPNQSDAVRKRGATDTAIGDLNDRASLDAALTDVHAVFYIAPAFSEEVTLGLRMVDAAKTAGVRRFVFSSVIDPVLSLSNHRDKAPIEEAIIESGMQFTLLHPTLFFQNLASSWPRIVQTGVFAEPWSRETSFSRVDYRDVAEAAAIALTEDRLLHGTFDCCADGAMNRIEVASLMSDIIGKPVRAETLDKAIALQHVRNDAEKSGLKAMFDWYDTHGLLGNALTLRAVLGREPRTLRAYLEELAAVT